MAIDESQLSSLEKQVSMPPTPDRAATSADTLAAIEGNAAEASAKIQRAEQQAKRDAAAFAARMKSETPPPAETAPLAPSAPEVKKGLFSRIGGWFKSAFEPSVEERSAAHAQQEAAKNPLVAQQMKAMEDAAPMSKDEFKRVMKEGAARAKAEAKAKAEQALKDQSSALGSLGIVGHNEAFGAMGAARSAVEAKAASEATKKAAAEAKAALTAGLSGKEAKIALGRASAPEEARSALSKKAESLIKKGDQNFLDQMNDDEITAEQAAAMSQNTENARAKLRKQKVVDVLSQAGNAVMEAKSAQAERLVRANQPKPMPNKNAGDQVLSDEQILADQALNERRVAQRKAEGSTVFSKKKPSYADTALSGITKAKQYVQYVREQTKRGPTVSEAVSALANADIHGAGMKAVDAGIDAVKAVGRGASYLREQAKRGPTVSEAVSAVANADIHGAGMKAVDATLDAGMAVGRGAKRIASKGADLLDKGLGATEKALVGSGGIVERAVQSTGRTGELAGKAADALLNAGPKILETALDAKAREAVKQRLAEKLAKLSQPLVSDQLLRDAGVVRKNDFEDPVWTKSLGKGDEDVPDEIADVVAETAAERSEGPANFAEVFSDLQRMEKSNNRSQMRAFAIEAENLEDLLDRNANPDDELSNIGDKFRGWKTADVKKLVKRLYDAGLLAK